MDNYTLKYMEAGREALGLAFRLRRIGLHKVRPEDLSALEKAAGEMAEPLSDGALESEKVLFGSPEGFGMMIRAIEEEGSTQLGSAHEVNWASISQEIRELVAKLRHCASDIEAIKNAEKLSEFFLQLDRISEEIVAEGAEEAWNSDLRYALSKF